MQRVAQFENGRVDSKSKNDGLGVSVTDMVKAEGGARDRRLN